MGFKTRGRSNSWRWACAPLAFAVACGSSPSPDTGEPGASGDAANAGGASGGAPVTAAGGGTASGGTAHASGGNEGPSEGSGGTEVETGTGGTDGSPNSCWPGPEAEQAKELGAPDAEGFAVWTGLASELDETALPTVGIVRWDLPGVYVTSAHIEFGLDTDYGTAAPVNLECPGRRTVLVGMKPEQTYHYRIVATDGTNTFTSEDRTLLTGAAPDFELLTKFDVLEPEEYEAGFFIGSFWTPIDSFEAVWTAFVVDSDGDLVWWHTVEPELARGELGYGRARLSANSQDMWLVRAANGGGALYRVSIDTLNSETYPQTVASHDIAAVSDDTMAFLDYADGDCTGISEIRKDGTVTPVFDPEATLGVSGCHQNSIHYSKTEDVYVVSHLAMDVHVIGRDGQLAWTLGDRVEGGKESWGGHQHGTQLLDDGILIFANETDSGAMALEFALDGTPRGELHLIDNTASATTFFGNVQRLPGGATLLASVFEMSVVGAGGEQVLDATFSTPLGYVEFRSSLYAEPDEILE